MKTSILGISAFYHDSAAALIVDGEIVAAAQEERFSRKKHDHEFPARAIRYCLDEAGLQPSDIVHVNAHGTSTDLNDAAEAEALDKVFGTSPGPKVTSTKGVTGHALGAAGALEAAAVVLSMQKRLIPHTVGLSEPDPEIPPLDFVMGEPVEWEPGPSISNSFGFGGHNGTLVIAPA